MRRSPTSTATSCGSRAARAAAPRRGRRRATPAPLSARWTTSSRPAPASLVVAALEGGTEPEQLGREIAERYRAMPRRARPVVVVADDFHRCDPHSLALLVFLAHHNHTFDVSYVLSCPADALPPGAADLRRVSSSAGSRWKTPGARLDGWTSRRVAVPVVDTLVALTDGNPLLLREVAEHLDVDQLEGRRTLPVRLVVPDEEPRPGRPRPGPAHRPRAPGGGLLHLWAAPCRRSCSTASVEPEALTSLLDRAPGRGGARRLPDDDRRPRLARRGPARARGPPGARAGAQPGLVRARPRAERPARPRRHRPGS